MVSLNKVRGGGGGERTGEGRCPGYDGVIMKPKLILPLTSWIGFFSCDGRPKSLAWKHSLHLLERSLHIKKDSRPSGSHAPVPSNWNLPTQRDLKSTGNKTFI